ncbi:hypothetical protein [Asticcacaulis sp. YBE204]|uniref:hypothetical protein n=1 Tax=Asticcacaulis sp. YBE204 TaxID=1282363 RepID=UPI0003C3B276|nr:hypothetical protein [Asticcacaulis sp. YBE204]ESQ78133.1 hypothetical protein AEYBE204_14920 [Asticcacaulis sp. YBE204]
MGLFLLSALALAILVVLCFPETSLAKSLRRHVFNKAADALNRMTLPKLIFILALVAGSFVFAYAFPVEIALLAAGDMAAYVEVMAAVMLMNAGTRLNATFVHLKATILSRFKTITGVVRLKTHRTTRAVRLQIRKVRITRDDNEDRPLSGPWAIAA